LTIDVSVVLTTYNRAPLLEGALAALALQETPDSLRWEVVVVDNNSRDRTPEVAAAAGKRMTVPVRYLFEPRQGQTHARNLGIREALGSVLAFIDDDVLPAPDWVPKVSSAMDQWNAHGVGGRILPRWEAPPPRWLADSQYLLNRLALMDFEDSRVLSYPMEGRPQVWGANMAFRRELFEVAGMFDTRRGMVGTKLSRGDEVDLINRALERGLRIVYDPSLKVFHRIGADRMRKHYFRKLVFDDAEAEARLGPIVDGRTFLGAPLWLYKVSLGYSWRALSPLISSGPDAFEQELEWRRLVGRLTGHWKAWAARRFTGGG
jgi:glycosyltransferase involved in cell wall biosynthesis